jgi:8-amino-7-oxononanoate synthase
MFEKFNALAETRAELTLANGINPFGVVLEHIYSATEADINGRRTILAGTNNYLGLTFDPVCMAAAEQALMAEGTGTTGSRMANGTYHGHVALERELAEFFRVPSAIVFSTGYQANLSLLSTLVDKDDVVMLDADCHASIYDGCSLGSAQIIRFRHNDPDSLDKRMARLDPERASKALIVIEGIYSMLGDQAPLNEFVDVKRKYGAYLMLDEAHSFGVLGEHGRGLAEEVGVEEDVDFVVGTFSKSLGTIGGFCVSRWPELENVRFGLRPYIFTASSAPSLIASARAALTILNDGRDLRKQLWANAHRLYAGLEAIGFKLGPETSPVVAVILPTARDRAMEMWQGLLERGIYVNLMVPPATPGTDCLLRCSLSAAHTFGQIDDIVNAFGSLSHLVLED